MLIYLQNIFWKKLIHWEKMATLMAPEEATCKQLPLVWNEKTACIEPVLLDSLAIECLHRVREVPGSIPNQGLRHTKVVKWYQWFPC